MRSYMIFGRRHCADCEHFVFEHGRVYLSELSVLILCKPQANP